MEASGRKCAVTCRSGLPNKAVVGRLANVRFSQDHGARRKTPTVLQRPVGLVRVSKHQQRAKAKEGHVCDIEIPPHRKSTGRNFSGSNGPNAIRDLLLRDGSIAMR